MNKKKRSIGSLFYNNRFIIIFSVLAAVGFWFFVAMVITPDWTTTIHNVPVHVNLEGTATEKLNLRLVEGENQTIDITITGKRYIISQITKDDFEVNVLLSEVIAPGEYNLDVSPRYIGKSENSNFIISDFSSKQLNFKFDFFETKSFKFSTDISALIFDKDFTADLPTSTVQEIVVDGPKTIVEKVVRVVAVVSPPEDEEPISKTVQLPAKVVLYDLYGKEVTDKNIKLSASDIEVTIPVLKTVTTPLKVDFVNAPAYFIENPLKYTVNPAKLLVGGASDVIDTLESIHVGEIDFSKLTEGNGEHTFNLTLPQGISSIEYTPNVKVKVDLSDYHLESVKVSKFNIINAPAGKKIRVVNSSITDVKVMVPKSLTDIDESTLTAVVNIENAEYNAGRYTVPVTIQSSEISRMWAVGEYSVIIQVE